MQLGQSTYYREVLEWQGQWACVWWIRQLCADMEAHPIKRPAVEHYWTCCPKCKIVFTTDTLLKDEKPGLEEEYCLSCPLESGWTNVNLECAAKNNHARQL